MSGPRRDRKVTSQRRTTWAMFSPDDTIVAIATPAGRGGIGVVRVSGPDAQAVARTILTRQAALEPRRATFTRVRTPQRGGQTLDTVVVTSFPAPHSYTGQDVVEIAAHGSPVVLHGIVSAAVDAGARLAEPGEFTFRAFLNGRLDLVQAEAVADLVDAVTPLQARAAFDQLEGTLTRRITELDAELFELIARLEASLDFPDEGYHFIDPAETEAAIRAVIGGLDRLLADAARGRLIREGATVVIAGRTNVGKSSLFNKLTGSDRAIVTPVPGTTRDLITERLDLEGVLVTLVDTAGTREAIDIVEREGVSRGEKAREVADLILLVLDASAPLDRDDEELLKRTEGRERVVVLNKCDIGLELHFPGAVAVSAATGEGIDKLRGRMAEELRGGEASRDTTALTNLRHVTLLREARDHLARAAEAAAPGQPEELLLVDLQAARTRFDEVVGRRTADDVLAHIFSRFCIGK